MKTFIFFIIFFLIAFNAFAAAPPASADIMALTAAINALNDNVLLFVRALAGLLVGFLLIWAGMRI